MSQASHSESQMAESPLHHCSHCMIVEQHCRFGHKRNIFLNPSWISFLARRLLCPSAYSRGLLHHSTVHWVGQSERLVLSLPVIAITERRLSRCVCTGCRAELWRCWSPIPQMRGKKEDRSEFQTTMMEKFFSDFSVIDSSLCLSPHGESRSSPSSSRLSRTK